MRVQLSASFFTGTAMLARGEHTLPDTTVLPKSAKVFVGGEWMAVSDIPEDETTEGLDELDAAVAEDAEKGKKAKAQKAT